MASVRKYYAVIGVTKPITVSLFGGVDGNDALNSYSLMLLASKDDAIAYVESPTLKSQYDNKLRSYSPPTSFLWGAAIGSSWHYKFYEILVLDDSKKIAYRDPNTNLNYYMLETTSHNIMKLCIYECNYPKQAYQNFSIGNLFSSTPSHRELLQENNEDMRFHAGIKNLFEDYCSLTRIVKGHWDRNHIDTEKSLLKQIEGKSIEDTLKCLAQVKLSLPDANPEGSFMRRLTYAIVMSHKHLESQQQLEQQQRQQPLQQARR